MNNVLGRMNLASRPFRNRRPRRRIGALLWSLVGLFVLWNLTLAVRYWMGSSSGRSELRSVREEIDTREAAMRTLQAELRVGDLQAQNEQVRFLNRKISERTFPWSLLFDDLVDVLPRNVRLLGLEPSIPSERQTRGGRAREAQSGSPNESEINARIEWINLSLNGVAKRSEDLLDLLDALFDSPSFSSPVLLSERAKDGEVDFQATVRYRVRAPLATAEVDQRVTEMAPGYEPEAGSSGELQPGAPRPGAGSSVATTSGSRPAGAESPNRTLDRQAPAIERGQPSRVATGQEAADLDDGDRTPADPEATRSPRRPNRGSGRQGGRGPASLEPVDDETARKADERFGTGTVVAPRLPRASGTPGGGEK